MTLRIILTVVEILLFVGVLAFFLNAIHRHLQHIAGNLTRIADGAKAIEDHCSIVGPGATEINSLLGEAAGNLTTAVEHAEAL